jgi:hypothetical protein
MGRRLPELPELPKLPGFCFAAAFNFGNYPILAVMAINFRSVMA